MGQITTPFRFKEIGGRLLVTNEVGDYGFFDPEMLKRYFSRECTDSEVHKLEKMSISFPNDQRWRLASLHNRARWTLKRESLGYIILIPTLRCDLSCTYCQVSRAPVDSKGYDWTQQTKKHVIAWLDSLESYQVKIEFQGGEPTLRLDLIDEIIEFCRNRFSNPEFVICTNLTNLSNKLAKTISSPDVFVSTSLDGGVDIMTAGRTANDKISKQIIANIQTVQKEFGKDKVSALPTITAANIYRIKELIDQYVEFGFSGIFIRPVNYQGFARKKHQESKSWMEEWGSVYEEAITYIAEINTYSYFEEFTLSHLVKKILLTTESGYVDHRSPAQYGSDYAVIDYDGKIYPTDESRMLSRIGQVDLHIGNVEQGIDEDITRQLNISALHHNNPDCVHCAYMPYCGVDIVDDISRYGRIDVPKHDTWFCEKQTHLFDLVFTAIEKRDRNRIDMFLKWAFRTGHPIGYSLIHD